MTPDVYASVRTVAVQARNTARMLQMIEQQSMKLREHLPPAALVWSEGQIPDLRRIANTLKRQCAAYARDTPVARYVAETLGLGDAVFFVLGQLPPLQEFPTVKKLWKYTGLDVRDGHSPRRRRGEKDGFSARLRSYVLYHLADPAMKQQGPHRAEYLKRKAHTSTTHPDMLPKGQCVTCDLARSRAAAAAAETPAGQKPKGGGDCASLGGPHWSPAHRHRDALRYAAKAILRDLWCAVNEVPVLNERPALPTNDNSEGEAPVAGLDAPTEGEHSLSLIAA